MMPKATLSKLILFSVIALTLSGCFRQAEEPFATLPPAQPTTELVTQPTSDSGVPVVVTPPTSDALVATQPLIITVEATANPLLLAPLNGTPTSLPSATPNDSNMMGGGGMLTDLIIVTNTPTSDPSPTSDLPATPTDAFFNPTGEAIEVSAECIYIVKSGETLLGIANRNGVAVSALRTANNITGDLIRVGDELVIPGCDAEPVTPTPGPTQTPVPSGFESYTVKSGDTLFSIARLYGTTVQAIVDANNLSNPDSLSIGDVLLIPNN
jgi:LysM repeat protein